MINQLFSVCPSNPFSYVSSSKHGLGYRSLIISVMPWGRHGFSNHWQLIGFFQQCVQDNSKENIKGSPQWLIMRGIHRPKVNFPQRANNVESISMARCLMIAYKWHGYRWYIYMMTSSNGNLSALLAICAGNSLVTGEFPAQRPLTRSTDVFFNLCLNERSGKQSWSWWFETQCRPLWRHSNESDYCCACEWRTTPCLWVVGLD